MNDIRLDNNGCFTQEILHWIERKPYRFLFETIKRNQHDYRSLLFYDPVATIECSSLAEVDGKLAEVQRAAAQGYYLAGFLSYETGFAFEPILQQTEFELPHPLFSFGVFEDPLIYDHRHQKFVTGDRKFSPHLETIVDHDRQSEPETIAFRPAITKERYLEALQQIKELIAAGDTYQVNFTFKVRFPWRQSAAALYQRLRSNQRVPFAAFLSFQDHKFISLSPELFFRLADNTVWLKPMKGTARRGLTVADDQRQRAWLQGSMKNRAENLMIVDLLRNDIGKIAKTGSVDVPRFFEIEKLETVFQATSTIKAELPTELSIVDLIKSLFPSGSITGAPKIRTMQIIDQLEHESRGIYTGGIGFIAPDRRAVFSVAIRSLYYDSRTKEAEMGIGSGVTYESDAEQEFEECIMKARFLTQTVEEFQLLETMRWSPETGWFLLDRHLARLRASARYFDFVFEADRVLNSIRDYEHKLRHRSRGGRDLKVRMTLDRDGACFFQHEAIKREAAEIRICFSSIATDSRDRLFYHKTTNRKLYDDQLKAAVGKGYFDLIFCNERGEITEGARSNIIIKNQNKFYTPPVECGLLAGIYRQYLFDQASFDLDEKIILPSEVTAAEEVYVCNSVRGLQKVILAEEKV